MKSALAQTAIGATKMTKMTRPATSPSMSAIISDRSRRCRGAQWSAARRWPPSSNRRRRSARLSPDRARPRDSKPSLRLCRAPRAAVGCASSTTRSGPKPRPGSQAEGSPAANWTEHIGPAFLEGDRLRHIRSTHFIDFVGDNRPIARLGLGSSGAMRPKQAVSPMIRRTRRGARTNAVDAQPRPYLAVALAVKAGSAARTQNSSES